MDSTGQCLRGENPTVLGRRRRQSGQRDWQMVFRAGVGAGVDGIFLEVHEDPSKAKSDAENALPLAQLAPLLDRLKQINAIVKSASTVSR